MLFERGVSARNFAKTNVDVFYGVEKEEGIKGIVEKVPYVEA